MSEERKYTEEGLPIVSTEILETIVGDIMRADERKERGKLHVKWLVTLNEENRNIVEMMLALGRKYPRDCRLDFLDDIENCVG